MLTREVLQPRSWLPTIALGLVSCWLAVLLAAGMMLLLTGCAEVKQVGGEIGGHVAEWTVCPLNLPSVITCGHVFQCYGASADTPSGYVEICINDENHPEQLDEIEAAFGQCEPTPRHEGLCDWHCDSGRGCNAFSGCWGCQ